MDKSLVTINIPLPDYFTYSAVNIYLIKEEPVTLIDTGPYTENILLILKKAFNEHNLLFSDIKRILLTHGHVDHSGLAGYFEKNFGTEVFIHKNDYSKIASKNEDKINFKKRTFVNLLEKFGFEKYLIEKLTIFFKDFYKFNKESANPIKILNEKTLEFEKSKIKILELPGHTAGSIGFLFNESALISGDTILNSTFVTPILEFDENFKSYKNLKNYYMTLKKILRLKNIKIFPGHGKGDFDFQKKTEELIKYIEKKALEIKEQLDFSKTLKENFENFVNTSPEKFFFHFSFFYGILEFLEIEDRFL